MKKTMFFVVLVMVVIGACAAQSASNDAQRIVGTWTLEKGSSSGNWATGTVWVFNANGTGTAGSTTFYYGISSGGNVYITELLTNETTKDAYVFFISPDGKRMIIYGYIFQKK